ncbi:MAG: UDP-N-acetylmuramate dehydrogenase [Bifidobacteriaceae bacterium]|nr:UDP-N-acetylmuramate dehydrogenase [Bifidobacteriaceae bacterium]
MDGFDLPVAGAPARPGAELAELTSFRIGGRPDRLIDCATEASLVAAVREADQDGRALLVMGGGSNLLAADRLTGLTVVRDRRGAAWAEERGGWARVTASAGASWDALVALAVERGWAGLAALSGIPGSVGAAPVQNVGAYGAEAADAIESVRVFDRKTDGIGELGPGELGFGYRDSALKRSMNQPASPTPRWVVLAVTFRLAAGRQEAPVRHDQLARALGVEPGQAAALAAIRRQVLAVRRAKGMVLDPADRDTWSAGSFFTNPVIPAAAARALPAGAPVFDAGAGLVKASAAWLIAHSGVAKGEGVSKGARAATSTKHVLALTNRGGATCADVEELADWIARRVRDRFGIELAREPVLVAPQPTSPDQAES